jgi:hypothetical protein
MYRLGRIKLIHISMLQTLTVPKSKYDIFSNRLVYCKNIYRTHFVDSSEPCLNDIS